MKNKRIKKTNKLKINKLIRSYLKILMRKVWILILMAIKRKII